MSNWEYIVIHSANSEPYNYVIVGGDASSSVHGPPKINDHHIEDDYHKEYTR